MKVTENDLMVAVFIDSGMVIIKSSLALQCI